MSTATELLRRAIKILGKSQDDEAEDLYDEIFDFLAAEKEAEPVAWVKITQYGDRRLSLDKLDGYEPLYTRPLPSRTPMTHEEIVALFESENPDTYFADFRDSIRLAEKHHGIGGDE